LYGVLNGMSGFVSRNGSCRYAIARINPFAEVYRFVERIVMIGEFSFCGSDFYVVNAVIVQHFFGYVTPRHSVAKKNFRVFFKSLLQGCRHCIAYQCYGDKYNPDYHIEKINLMHCFYL
jgi:hypothetical protein